MKIRRTDDPDISFVAADDVDPVALWCYRFVEFKVDTRQHKFILTPILRDGSEGPVIDATEAYDQFKREREQR